MDIIDHTLRGLSVAARTFDGGTILTKDNRDQLVDEMHTYLNLRKAARFHGASPYEIELACRNPSSKQPI